MLRFDRLPDGTYKINANWVNGGDEYSASSLVTIRGGDVDRIELQDETGVKLEGTLEYQSGGAGGAATIILERCDGNLIRGIGVLTVATRPGTRDFAFTTVPPGQYAIHVIDKQSSYVSALRTGAEWRNDSRFTVAPGMSPLKITVQLNQDSAAIAGSMQDSDGSEIEGVVIAKSEISGELYRVKTDQSGRFALSGLAPGAYRLFSWRNDKGVEYRNPAFLQAVQQDSTSVIVASGQHLEGISLVPIGTAK